MGFVKRGEDLPIVGIVRGTDEDEEIAKEALESLKQDAKNISKDGNKIESKLESTN